MEITPLTIFYGSMLALIVAALFAIMFRQGRSPTYGDMLDLERQTRDELRAEIKEAIRVATIEIGVEINRQIADVNLRIDEVNNRIDEVNNRIDQMNNRIDGLRQDINRVLAALASHEHVDGRVMMTVQTEAEPAQAAGN